ncbi:MAG: hypothetical protein NTY45_04215 [Elusimicrobia bacterium]|nr:hypothetical protein [Elusimicrobiota bacterium]
MKNIKYLLIALFLGGCSGIAFNKTPEAKEDEVTGLTFEYPKKDVFDACVRTLESNGWTVTLSDYEEGVINGVRRPDSNAASESAPAQQTARVSVVEKVSGKTVVKITAGLSSPNPGGEAAGSAPVAKNMPEVCRPLLNSIQETLLKPR